jgi:hypothetical protein
MSGLVAERQDYEEPVAERQDYEEPVAERQDYFDWNVVPFLQTF